MSTSLCLFCVRCSVFFFFISVRLIENECVEQRAVGFSDPEYQYWPNMWLQLPINKNTPLFTLVLSGWKQSSYGEFIPSFSSFYSSSFSFFFISRFFSCPLLPLLIFSSFTSSVPFPPFYNITLLQFISLFAEIKFYSQKER